MAKIRAEKIVKAAVKAGPKAAKKVATTAKVKKVRAAAQSAAPKTVFSKPIKGTKTMTDTFKAVQDTVTKAASEAGEKATTMFKDVNVRAKKAFEQSGELTKDVVEFNKANLEAAVEAGKLAAKGAQTAAQKAIELGKKNWEATSAHAKAVAGVKAPADFFTMQNEFARTQFDAAVSEMSKSTEFYLKLAGEVVAPLQNRYAVVVDQFKARMAA
jgi:phasin family protein